MRYIDNIPSTFADQVRYFAELYTWRPAPTKAAGAPVVRANMVSSLDGGVYGANHSSNIFADPTDQLIMNVLRHGADVLLVGAGTVRAEGYAGWQSDDLLMRVADTIGQPAASKIAIVTSSGQVPEEFLNSPETLLITSDSTAARLSQNPGVQAEIVACGTQVNLSQGISQLVASGYRNILCEGGPNLLGALLDANCLHELCLRLAPVIVGGTAKRIVDMASWHSEAAELKHLVRVDSNLYLRWQLH